MATLRPALIELPADDAERARRFWGELLGGELEERGPEAGRGWELDCGGRGRVGVHERGTGPGDTASLPYFEVADMAAAIERLTALGGAVVHAGERWTICRDSEGSPFALELSGGGARTGAESGRER